MNPADTDYAITSRRSVRAFLRTPVPRATVGAILDVAARAPSGTNMQPWRVHVVAGEERQRLSDAVRPAFLNGGGSHASEYSYYPDKFFEPYLTRRRKIGWDLYSLLGIAKGDVGRMALQHARNFDFFDAPVGMIFTIERRLKIGSWLDFGTFLENIMIAARARDLDTCPQAAWAPMHAIVREVLALEPEELVVCGMALGYADPDAPENRLVTEREPATAFSTFRGFLD